MRRFRAMHVATAPLIAVILGATGLHAECRPGHETVRVRVSLRPAAKGIELAGLVLSVAYPADKLVIEGQGKDAAHAAVSKLPDGAFTTSEDRDGELRLVVAKAKAFAVDPLCEITFQRCEGAKAAAPEEISCRVTDASDAMTSKVKVEDVRCSVGAAS